MVTDLHQKSKVSAVQGLDSWEYSRGDRTRVKDSLMCPQWPQSALELKADTRIPLTVWTQPV